jgi:hypothetical protein
MNVGLTLWNRHCQPGSSHSAQADVSIAVIRWVALPEERIQDRACALLGRAAAHYHSEAIEVALHRLPRPDMRLRINDIRHCVLRSDEECTFEES